MAIDYDVIVVGSGFGGSVAALRLTEKGYKVLVLEAGREFKDHEFAKSSWRVRDFLFAPAIGCYGIQRIHMLPDVMILAGAGVGGGSLVYANTMYEPPAEFFAQGPWSGITDWQTELKPFYDLARRMLGVEMNTYFSPADAAMKDVADRMGVGESFKLAPVAVHFGKGPGIESPDPYFGGVGPARKGCTNCGECMTGCRHNAKNTLDKNYLALVLINDLIEDTTGVDADSILAITELMNGNEKYFVKIYNAIADNNFNLCDSIYTMLSDSIEDTYLKEDYESLAPIIELEKALKSSNRNYHQLDNLEIQNLRSLARNEYASTGTIMAQNILGNAVGDEFEPYLKFPEEQRERRSKPQQQQIPAPTGLEAAFFKLYPNPAKNQTNLSYVLLPGQKGVASISDSNGKVVYETILSNDQNSISIELSNLAPSTYFLNVIVDNIVKYKETLVVRK